MATDKPVYPPWFVNNKPTTARATRAPWRTRWRPSSASPSPRSPGRSAVQQLVRAGAEEFDFDVNEISYSPQRAQVVTFSDSYYDVQQALVALKNSPIVTKRRPGRPKGRRLQRRGRAQAQACRSSTANCRPSQTPEVFETLNDVKQALQTERIAALVTDTPTADFITTEIPGSTVVAQSPSTGEHYGLLFAKGNKLVTCVNKALATLKGNGTLAKLTGQYLKDFTSVPTIQP